jgi:hypothetical protein
MITSTRFIWIKATSSCGARHLSRQYNECHRCSCQFPKKSYWRQGKPRESKQILSTLQVTCSCHLLDLR